MRNFSVDYDDEDELLPFNKNVVIFEDFEDKLPRFSYRFISVDKSEFCFNNSELTTKEFVSYFESIKRLSQEPVSYLIEESSNKEFRFHRIAPHIIKKEISNIWTLLGSEPNHSKNEDNWPEFGQFEVYTEEEKAPRIIFCLGNGVFYLLRFDLHHKTYKRKV